MHLQVLCNHRPTVVATSGDSLVCRGLQTCFELVHYLVTEASFEAGNKLVHCCVVFLSARSL